MFYVTCHKGNHVLNSARNTVLVTSHVSKSKMLLLGKVIIFFKERLGQGPEQSRCRGPGPQEDRVITLCLPLEVEASGRSREMRGP
jgi:hypothetical protein